MMTEKNLILTKNKTIRVTSPLNGITLFEIAIVNNEPTVIIKKPQESKYELIDCDLITSLVVHGIIAANINGCVFSLKEITDKYSVPQKATEKPKT